MSKDKSGDNVTQADNDTNKVGSQKNLNSKPKEKPVRRKNQKEKIKDLEAELAEANEKTIRTRAEFDNYRKRMQRDMSEIRTLTKISTLEEILPVKDHFQMAMTAANSSDDLETLKQGMNMILTEFDRCFDNLGVEKVPTDGKIFDPKVHEAVSTEASTEIEEEHVIREWKTGYKIGEQLLRPASVVVSSGETTEDKSE